VYSGSSKNSAGGNLCHELKHSKNQNSQELRATAGGLYYDGGEIVGIKSSVSVHGDKLMAKNPNRITSLFPISIRLRGPK
jgi:hypothetical protein